LKEPLVINVNNYFNEKYDELTKFLLNKDVINEFDILAQKINRLFPNKLDGKKLLLCWLICAFPQYTIQIKKHKLIKNTYPSKVYFICQKMINLLDLCSYKSDFFKTVFEYSNTINYFLSTNKIDTFNALIDEWIELNKTMKLVFDNKDLFIEIGKSRTKIFGYLQKITPNLQESTLKDYAKIIHIYENKLKKIEKNILAKDIKEKKYIILQNVIKNIKDSLILLSNGKLKDELEDKFDEKFVIQQIKYSDNLKNTILAYGNFLIDIIIKLQAPVHKGNTLLMWKNIKIEDNLIVNLFLFVINQINNIRDNIMNLFVLSELGVDFIL
jgi:hypothetical protein